MWWGSCEDFGLKAERCVLVGTHLRSGEVVAVTAPEVVRDQEPEYPVSHFVESLVPAYVHLSSGHRGNSKNVFNRSADGQLVSSRSVNKFLTESRASYLCWHCGELSSGPLHSATVVVLCLPSPTSWQILSAVNSTNATQWSKDKRKTAVINTGQNGNHIALANTEMWNSLRKNILNEIPSKCTQKKLLG